METESLTNLRAIIIEDNPVDTEMFGSILRTAGYEVLWDRVATESEYVSSLKHAPDIVIADYSSPRFDVSRALQILKEKGSDIPFIMVTGTICETTAINCMQKGASDYLFRDRLTRLGHSVAQALSNNGAVSGRERADEILKRSEERYKNIIDNIHEGYFEVNLAGNFTFFNDSLCRIFGYFRHELMGMNNRDYTTPKTAKKIYKQDKEINKKPWYY